MKRVLLPLIIVTVLVALVGGTLWFLYTKSQKKPTVWKTETPEVMDIVKKTVATGAIVPRQEVEIKPRVSGVLETLAVEPGQYVHAGDEIGKIQIVPDAVNLNRAESDVQAKRIAFTNAKRELDRNQKLFAQGVVSEAEVAKFQTDYDLKRAELDAAVSNLQLVKDGATRSAKGSNIVVTSTVDGMVIDVPVKVGFSVIESNNFNAGTTIAVVADMNDMIFQGQVDESEVGKIKEGMKLQIKIGALDKEQFEGTLEYISPKGNEVDGAIQFEIKAAIVRKPEVFIRANYSANADIVLDEARQVLAMREGLLQFADGKPYVEVEVGKQTFERRDVELGLSDGINVEVKSGVAAGDKIKVPANAGPPGMGGPGGRRFRH
ncbi:MAG: efflux RND transporter periplasmic adaptor subunit [Kofleriaceae bacterium]|nr:efflux RND transporter periplasmic adaptor subunit [Myxococcales bacterium]MCB9564361.1 efflux RND transporter periplasmic adaptor subunit [Kofleriaceae bacterium]MCB9575229.1 efflux RND transporter periplasmic adaptor subunit [Kofleriaceae bacterium]